MIPRWGSLRKLRGEMSPGGEPVCWVLRVAFTKVSAAHCLRDFRSWQREAAGWKCHSSVMERFSLLLDTTCSFTGAVLLEFSHEAVAITWKRVKTRRKGGNEKEKEKESTRSTASQCTQLCLYRGPKEMYFVPAAGLLAPRSFISTHPLGLSARLNPPVLRDDPAYVGSPLTQGLSTHSFSASAFERS